MKKKKTSSIDPENYNNKEFTDKGWEGLPKSQYVKYKSLRK